MKLTAAITTVSLLAASAASSITLQSSSTNPALDKKYLSGLHEGAGLNGVYLTDSEVGYEFNSTSNEIYINVDSFEWPLRVFDQTLLIGVAGDPLVYPIDGKLTVNGSSEVFYACKPGVPYDPYHYSENSYGVAVFGEGDAVPSTCEAITLDYHF